MEQTKKLLPYPKQNIKHGYNYPTLSVQDVFRTVFVLLQSMVCLFGIDDGNISINKPLHQCLAPLNAVGTIIPCKQYGFFNLKNAALALTNTTNVDPKSTVTFTTTNALFENVLIQSIGENTVQFAKRVNAYLDQSLFPFEFKVLCRCYAFLHLTKTPMDVEFIRQYFTSEQPDEKAIKKDVIHWLTLYHLQIHDANKYAFSCSDSENIHECIKALNDINGFRETYDNITSMYRHFLTETRKDIVSNETSEMWLNMTRESQLKRIQRSIQKYVEMYILPTIETYQIGLIATPFLYDNYDKPSESFPSDVFDTLIEMLFNSICPSLQRHSRDLNVYMCFTKLYNLVQNKLQVSFDAVDNLRIRIDEVKTLMAKNKESLNEKQSSMKILVSKLNEEESHAIALEARLLQEEQKLKKKAETDTRGKEKTKATIGLQTSALTTTNNSIIAIKAKISNADKDIVKIRESISEATKELDTLLQRQKSIYAELGKQKRTLLQSIGLDLNSDVFIPRLVFYYQRLVQILPFVVYGSLYPLKSILNYITANYGSASPRNNGRNNAENQEWNDIWQSTKLYVVLAFVKNHIVPGMELLVNVIENTQLYNHFTEFKNLYTDITVGNYLENPIEAYFNDISRAFITTSGIVGKPRVLEVKRRDKKTLTFVQVKGLLEALHAKSKKLLFYLSEMMKYTGKADKQIQNKSAEFIKDFNFPPVFVPNFNMGLAGAPTTKTDLKTAAPKVYVDTNLQPLVTDMLAAINN